MWTFLVKYLGRSGLRSMACRAMKPAKLMFIRIGMSGILLGPVLTIDSCLLLVADESLTRHNAALD